MCWDGRQALRRYFLPDASGFPINKYGGSGLELYCPNCQKIEYGTEPEIYNLASEFVETVEFDYFPDMDDEDRHQKLNVAKVCDILGWIYRRTSVLDETGLHKDSLAEFE